MGKLKYGKIIYFLISILLLLISLVIGPLDVFTHGYYYNEIDITGASNNLGSSIDLTKGAYEMHFSPSKDHFTGFEIMLTNQPAQNSGFLYLDIENESGTRLERIAVDLSKVKNQIWYKTYSKANLKKGQIYTLKFSIQGTYQAVPQIVTIDTDYLNDETIDGNAAVVYAYKESTFNFPTKVLLILIIFSLWMYITSAFVDTEKYRKFCSVTAACVFMTAILAWNYMFNSMDNTNSLFNNFQADSETLVTGPMYAELDGIGGLNGFGLGRYYNKLGTFISYNTSAIDDANWNKGYSKTEPAVVVNSNLYTQNAIIDVSQIRFKNGESFNVSEVQDDGTNIVIKLNSPWILDPGKYGDIEDITFINSQGQESAYSLLVPYTSQFGLQGKLFRQFARLLPSSTACDINNLYLLCSVATAAIFVVITLLLATKYNTVMAGVFYFTFWLSPWIVNFARNLYWVEFTWFIPMAVGLTCSLKITEKRWRIGCYIAAFIAITGKCLCGYEYITSVMLGLISFLLADLVVAFFNHDKERLILLFRTIFILGVIALIGFATAICIHAPLRANGDLIEGIKTIIKGDVLRRTTGGDLNDWGADLWPSFNASIWDVYRTYFKFSTNVITGITGNLFPLLCCMPLLIFVYDYKKGKLNKELPVLYVIFFITAISWFVLAKSHSYVHTHMNYVMWYFGFVQICLYVCVNKLVEIYKNINKGGLLR